MSLLSVVLLQFVSLKKARQNQQGRLVQVSSTSTLPARGGSGPCTICPVYRHLHFSLRAHVRIMLHTLSFPSQRWVRSACLLKERRASKLDTPPQQKGRTWRREGRSSSSSRETEGERESSPRARRSSAKARGVRRPRPRFVGQCQNSSAGVSPAQGVGTHESTSRAPAKWASCVGAHECASSSFLDGNTARQTRKFAARPQYVSTWCLGNPLQAIWRAKGACRRSPRARGNKWVIDTPPALNPSRGSFTPAPTANKNQRRHPRTNPDAPPPARQRDSRQPEDAEAREADDVDLCKDVRLSNRSKMQLPIRAMAMCIEGTQVQTRPPSGERTGSGDEARGRGWGCGFDCAAFG